MIVQSSCFCVPGACMSQLCDQCGVSTRTGQIFSCAETPHSRLTQCCILWVCDSLDTMESTGRQPAPNTPRLPSWTTALSWQARLGRSTMTNTCCECLWGANSTARTHTHTHIYIPHTHINNTETQPRKRTCKYTFTHTYASTHTHNRRKITLLNVRASIHLCVFIYSKRTPS